MVGVITALAAEGTQGVNEFNMANLVTKPLGCLWMRVHGTCHQVGGGSNSTGPMAEPQLRITMG